MVQTERVNENTELNWFKLVPRFYEKKILILLTTLLGLMIGLAFIFFTKPVYQAKIKLGAASEGAIAMLNQGRSWNGTFLKPKTDRTVYIALCAELLSESVKEDFFKQYYLPALSQSQKDKQPIANLYAAFVKNLTIAPSPLTVADKFTKYSVAIRGTDAQQSAIWLKQFTDLIKERTLKALLGDMQQENAVVIGQLNHQIEIARTMAKAKRLDRITRLKEKIRVAQLASANNNFWDDEPTMMDGAHEGVLLNMDEIQAEIKSLSTRQSDDAFIPDLRKLQAKLELYKSLTMNLGDVSVFSLDGTIATPIEPIAPKKRLIVMLSLCLGFLAGIFIVMFQMAWRKEKYGEI